MLRVERQASLGTKTSFPGPNTYSSPPTSTGPEPDTPTKITSTSSLRCSPTPRPAPKWIKLAFRSSLASKVQITPSRATTEAATASRFVPNIGTRSNSCSPGLPTGCYINEANGVACGLHSVAHPDIACKHRLRSGLYGLAFRRKADTTLADAQRDRSGRGVLFKPVSSLHRKQHHI